MEGDQVMRVESLQSCPILCNPMDCSPSGFSVHGIFQARILEWVAIPCSRGSSQPRIEPTFFMSPASAGRFFTTSAAMNEISGFVKETPEGKARVGQSGRFRLTYIHCMCKADS